MIPPPATAANGGTTRERMSGMSADQQHQGSPRRHRAGYGCRRRGWQVVGMAMILMCGGAPAFGDAAPQPVGGQDRVDHMMGRYNVHPAIEKLGRGLSNVLFGWLEIPLGVHKRYSAQDTVGSTLTGVGIGLFKGVARTAVGAYETVTFFLPLPEHFAPILPTLEYFQHTRTRGPLPLE